MKDPQHSATVLLHGRRAKGPQSARMHPEAFSLGPTVPQGERSLGSPTTTDRGGTPGEIHMGIVFGYAELATSASTWT